MENVHTSSRFGSFKASSMSESSSSFHLLKSIFMYGGWNIQRTGENNVYLPINKEKLKISI